jgi:hypothetical protein
MNIIINALRAVVVTSNIVVKLQIRNPHRIASTYKTVFVFIN